MRDVMVDLKQLRLHGMAGAWADLAQQASDSGLDSARWLVEHLLQAEAVDRGMRRGRDMGRGREVGFPGAKVDDIDALRFQTHRLRGNFHGW